MAPWGLLSLGAVGCALVLAASDAFPWHLRACACVAFLGAVLLGAKGGGGGGDGAPSEGTPPAAAAEHQILLAGCSGAGKTTLFRQLGLAFGPGASFTALEKLQAAARIRSCVLAAMVSMVRFVHEFVPERQHDLGDEDLRALLLWVVEVRLRPPLAPPIAACVSTPDDEARVVAAAELARRLATAFGVDERDILCPTLEEAAPDADGEPEPGALSLSFVLCVAGAHDERGLWGRMGSVERALATSLGAEDVTVYDDAEEIVRYLCPSDRTDAAYAEKWAYWRRAVRAIVRLWSQSDAISQAWQRRDEHAHTLGGRQGLGPSSAEHLPYLIAQLCPEELCDDGFRPAAEAMLRVHCPTSQTSSVLLTLPPARTAGGLIPSLLGSAPKGNGSAAGAGWRARLWDGGGRRECRAEVLGAFSEQLASLPKREDDDGGGGGGGGGGLGAVVCVVSMADFDRAVLAEDGETERMEEALDHLAELGSSALAQQHELRLLLTKSDVFARKLEEQDMAVVFNSYLAGLAEGRDSLALPQADFPRAPEEAQRVADWLRRYERDPGLLQRVQPYARSRRYYEEQGVDFLAMGGEEAAPWWTRLSVFSGGGAAAQPPSEAELEAAARVRRCGDAYRNWWRSASPKEKEAEKAAAADYVREFMVAVAEGARQGQSGASGGDGRVHVSMGDALSAGTAQLAELLGPACS